MKDFLTKAFDLSEMDAQIFSEAFEKNQFRKGSVFIEYGKTSDKIGFVKSGLLKCTLIGENKSIVDDFVFENQFVANYYSFLKRECSNKEISCLTDSVIYIISKEKLEELGSKYAFIEKIARLVSEQLFLSTAKKLENIRLLSAEERYLKLIKTNKKFFK